MSALQTLHLPFEGRLFFGNFLCRPNRFLVIAHAESREWRCFLHDPGRLKELLTPGAKLLIRDRMDRGGSTEADIVAVEHEGILVSLNSTLPNRLVGEALRQRALELFAGYASVRAEVKRGRSRFDFLLEGEGRPPCYVEVKSCTLNVGGRGLFPDAPTERGRRHVEELAALKREGNRCAIIFLVQRQDVEVVSPHEARDPAFAQALREADAQGVEVVAYGAEITVEGITLRKDIPVDVGYSSRECGRL